MGFFDSLTKTVKSLGGAVAAPYGVAYDLATAPFDDKDDDLGSIMGKVAHRAGNVLDPFINDDTWTGYGFGKVMQGLDYAYQNAVDDPLTTYLTGFQHASAQDTVGERFGALFDSDTWASSYKLAKESEQSFGQSAVYGFSNLDNHDPLSVKEGEKPYDVAGLGEEHPTTAGILSFGIDLGTMWYTDPGVLAGKAAAVAKRSGLGRLKEGDEFDLFGKMGGTSEVGGARVKRWEGRLDKYFDYISGNNTLGRKLNAKEIHASSPELQRDAVYGKAIAGLMDDALKLDNPTDAKNAMRRIIAVSAGDVTQIDRLRTETQGTQAIADALDNIAKGSVTHLELQALRDGVNLNPEFNAMLQTQLDNLNVDGAVDNFVKEWSGQVQAKLNSQNRLMEVESAAEHVPGRHTAKANRMLRREAGTSLGANVAKAHDNTLQFARDLANRTTYSNVFQKSLYHVPLVVLHPLALAASPYTKGLKGASDSIRTTHFMGVGDLHDWSGTTTQLDSMMRIAGVDDAARGAEITAAMKATGEPERLSAIRRVERVAVNALAARLSEKTGRDIGAREFLQAIGDRAAMHRRSGAAVQDGGRIYAATKAEGDMAADLRTWSAVNAEKAGKPGINESLDEGIVPPSIDSWRIDQIPDEDGIPLALPLITTQLANKVPLFDVHLAKKLMRDERWSQKFSGLSEAWRDTAVELDGLQAAARNMGAAVSDTLAKSIISKRNSLEALVHAGSMMTRWWKYSVLTRLGYPMRVMGDEHMRIAAQTHWTSFVLANTREGIGNDLYNNAPAWIHRGGRKAQARQALTIARGRYAELESHMGRTGKGVWSDDEWQQLSGAARTLASKKATAEEFTNAQRIADELDPDGKVVEYVGTLSEARRLHGAINSRRSAVKRWREQLGDPDADVPTLNQKIAEAEAKIADDEAGRSHLLEQLGDTTPDELHAEMRALQRVLKRPKAFRDDIPMKRLGMNDVKLDDELWANGVYQGPGGTGYRMAAGSNDHWDYQLTDGEATTRNLISSGAHRTVEGREPGHTHVWANVLNYQFRNSPEMMAFIRGDVKNAEEFAAWVRLPENKYIRDRVRHYAVDPEGWGDRLHQMFLDYVPSLELRAALKEGRVTAGQLGKMFPDVTTRPAVHGQLANVNTGRHSAARLASDGFQRFFKLLSEQPTDNLVRHPYMNAMYKHHLRKLYASRKNAYAKMGKDFSQDDLYHLERQARNRALSDLKRTLWDVSAHSNAAHAMRFISPFFAAHQEALTRWWRIVSDDPSIVRKFQLAFDAPRKAGLVYDSRTGEAVQPGESISPSHQIMLRIPFAGENSAVNKWVKNLGGGKYWRVNENGFNLILQNGIANPGVGPVVTLPMEELVNKYADEPAIERMARIINPFPPDEPVAAVQPAWSKRLVARIQGAGNKEWGRYYQQNLADGVIKWRLEHGETVPTEKQFDMLTQRAADDTNRDLGLMLLSNLTSPAPAKPESKYALVQHGIQKIKTQADQQGKDFAWIRDQVREKYGDIYTALLYSQTSNPSRLETTPAEVRAYKKRKGILNKTDPSLARMILGPDAKMDGDDDDPQQQYSAAAKRFFANQKTRPGSTDTYISGKDPDEAAVANLIDAGWTQYEQMTNWLQVEAEKQGLTTYEESDALVAAKRAGLDYIKSQNFAFKEEWDSYGHGDDYGALLDDMRKITSDRGLRNDPTRRDIYWLDQYIQLRDTVDAMLAQRKAAGEPYTIKAQGNADIAAAFKAGVLYIKNQNTFFESHHYNGIIEKDPYLIGVD